MKLRTSFFKPVALKKDILRFAPIWALYLIGMMMILLEMGSYNDYDNFARNHLPGLVTAFGIVNLCYAGISANLLFGDLYNTKMCYSLHAMPYRRESWLATHLIAGLLFSLVPNLIASAYMMFRLEDYWFLALYWLLASTLQFIFFYGVATVSALLTGNRFAMLLVYAGFNFVAMLLYATVEVIYLPMLEGVLTNVEGFTRFSPVVQLFQYKYFTFTRIENQYTDIYDTYKYFYRYDGLSDGWGYLAILGCVGVVAMFLSFWLYRKRHLESAGDFIAFPKLKGLACVIMTLCVTLCFALVGELFGNTILWLIVGLIIGFFGSLMLLERRLKVFRKRTFLGFAAMAVAVTLSVLAIYCDWFGIESWTPKAGHVASVTVSDTRNDHPSYNGLRTTLEDEYDIQQIITAHQDALTHLDDMYNGKQYIYVYLTYQMKSGRTVTRYYRVPFGSESYDVFRGYLYNTESVLGFTDAAAAAPNITYMYTSAGEVTPDMYEKVLIALQKDAANGFVDMDHSEKAYYIEYSFMNEEGENIYRSLSVHKQASEFSALMQDPQFQMGYTDWDQLMAGMKMVDVMYDDYGLSILGEDWEDLLITLRKDVESGNAKANEYVPNSIRVYYESRVNGRNQYREFYITSKNSYVYDWLNNQGYLPKEVPHG